ncbi:MAG: hypothetical protein AVDCRST_MAG76-2487, partial [uncultured Acidimicrobiales bacterium]
DTEAVAAGGAQVGRPARVAGHWAHGLRRHPPAAPPPLRRVDRRDRGGRVPPGRALGPVGL